MGTRHITKIINEKGETKVSNYGQWDGYPMGQGLDILKMLLENKEDMISRLETNLETIKTITNDEELQQVYIDNGFTISKDGFISMEESQQRLERLPQLHRDTGSKIISLIADNIGLETIFSEDEGWCEYTNTINFKTRTFEIAHTGEEKTPIFTTNIDNPLSVEEFEKKFDD